MNRVFEDVGTHFVGSIELRNEVFITDPCYEPMTWYNELLTNVSAGIYKCFVVISDEHSWGHRVAELHVIKEDILDKYTSLNKVPYDKEPLDVTIGVDSGQCGMFDAAYFEDHYSDDDYDNKESWYRKVCDLTCDYNVGITDKLGVVCSSGYGDGAYDLWVAKDKKGNVVAMKVCFISLPKRLKREISIDGLQ